MPSERKFKLLRIVIITIFASFFPRCKRKIVGVRRPLLQMTNKFFSFENVSFAVPGVQLTSTAITLLNLMIVLSLFYADLGDTCQSSIKLTTNLA